MKFLVLIVCRGLHCVFLKKLEARSERFVVVQYLKLISYILRSISFTFSAHLVKPLRGRTEVDCEVGQNEAWASVTLGGVIVSKVFILLMLLQKGKLTFLIIIAAACVCLYAREQVNSIVVCDPLLGRVPIYHTSDFCIFILNPPDRHLV